MQRIYISVFAKWEYINQAGGIAYLNPETLRHITAEYVCTQTKKSVSERGIVRVALSGGNTAKLLHECLVGWPFIKGMRWSCLHLFWGDKRCVWTDHPENNFGMVQQRKILLETFRDLEGIKEPGVILLLNGPINGGKRLT